MPNSLLKLIQTCSLGMLFICGAWVPPTNAQSGPMGGPRHKNGSSKPAAARAHADSEQRTPRPAEPRLNFSSPPDSSEYEGLDDDDLGEEIVEDLVSATASSVMNAGLQGGLDWLSFRRDPAQGLADPYVQNVIRLKQSTSPKVRVKAAVGLLRVPCPAASKPFLKAALKNDSSEEVRKTCAIALGRIGDDECRDYLEKAMKYDASKEVRLVCSAVLAKMDGAGVGAGK